MTQTASIAVLRRAFVGRLLALEQLRVCEIKRHHEDENRDGEDKRVHRVVMVENDQPDDGGDADIDEVAQREVKTRLVVLGYQC